MGVQDVAAAARVWGHDFLHDEIAMMTGDVAETRKQLLGRRSREIDVRIEPAIDFDPRLPGVKYPTGESGFALSEGPAPEFDGDTESLAFASAVELSRLVQARKVTSVALTKMYLRRLDTMGRRLNAVITLTADRAMEQAERADRELAEGKSRGPLHGLPWGAKDLLATKGIATTWGVRPCENQVFDYDATVVQRLADAGAVLCAKLSLGELAMGDVWFGGRTKCPWDETQGSGGSSAGPAAAVAGGLVVFAIGSETMGSIVSPCMINGVVGLRPTYGRISRHGAMALSRTMDKLGPMCRGVEDAAMVLRAIHGADGMDPTAAQGMPFRFDGRDLDVTGLRVGIDVATFEELGKSKNEQKRAIYADAVKAIRELAGRDLIPVQLPDPAPYRGIAGTIIAAESANAFTELIRTGEMRQLAQQGPSAWPNTFREGSLIPAADYLRAMQIRRQLMHAMDEALREVDVYITAPYVGPTIAMTNLTGHPTVITRCGILDGRPVMIEFLAQPYREDAALRLACAYERSAKWSDVWPAL